jgi:hypothetical protein
MQPTLRRMPTVRRGATLVALAALAVTAAACGGSSSSSGGVASIASGGTSTISASATSTTSSANRQALLMKAAQCMRTNGVTTFPDPTVDSNGNVRLQGLRGLNRNDPVVAKAFAACQPLFRAARPQFSPAQQVALQNALLAYAKCVRAHGYNMPDPTFGGGGGGPASGGGAFGSSINRNDPKYVKARAACRSVLVAAGIGRGGGGGGGGGGFFFGGAG